MVIHFHCYIYISVSHNILKNFYVHTALCHSGTMEKDELELSERQITILDAVIRNYLATGEPVGSRTISKYTDLNLSSATIRNEMSDLEEMGYIVQPHTSAGRIPSDKGYRLYVDHLIEQNEKKDKEISDMKEFVIEKTEKMDKILKQAAKMLATNTNYATLVSAPDVNHNKVKFIQLSQVDDQHLLAVIVMNNNMVRNKMVNLYEALDNETILKLNILLNTSLNGLAALSESESSGYLSIFVAPLV